MSSQHLKEAYEVEAIHKAFYTGGLVEWTSDGNFLICQCTDSIKVINLESGIVKCSLGESNEDAEEDIVYCFALSKDCKHILSAHKSGLIKYWSLDESKLIKLWRSIHKGPIATIVFDSSGDIVATGGSDGTAKLWDIVHQTCIYSLKGCQGVFGILTFHPDKDRNLLFGSGDDMKIFSWNTSNGELQNSYSGHFSKVTSLNITYDGKYMVSSGRDRVLILWDIDDGKAIRTLPVFEVLEGSVILPIKFQLPERKIKKSDGGIYVACAGEKGAIKIWEMLSTELVYEQKNSLISPATEDGNSVVTQLLFNDMKRCLCMISADHNILIYDLSTFECNKQMVGFTDEILDIIYLGKDDTHAAVATNSIDIKIYELSSMNCQLVKGHKDLVLSLTKSPYNDNLFVSSSKDNTIRIWLMNISNNVSCIGIGNRHTASVGSVCLPYTDFSCCFSVSQDTCIKKWILPTFDDNLDANLLTCSHTEIAHPKDINCVSISPNDQIVATASQDKTIKLWSAESLSVLGTLKGHKRGVWCVRFSPIDQVLLSTSADCSIKLWSLTDLNCLKTLEGHVSSVLKAEFISKGLQIVSSGADGLLKIWNIKTSESVMSLDKHEGRVWAMAVSQTENHIITGGADSLLIKWRDVTIENKEKEAMKLEKIVLQEQELSNLLHDKKLTKALRLSLKLDKPYHTLKIIKELLKEEDDSVLAATIKDLNANDRDSLAKCCIEWNTNTKNCYVAQAVLNVMLSNGYMNKSSPQFVASLLPYTKRHFERVTNALQDLELLTFTINCMQPYADST